jgi:carboxylate-amine ligase
MDYNAHVRQQLGACRILLEKLYDGFGTNRAHDRQAFSFGIEEEYFLADSETKDVSFETPERLFMAAGAASGGRIGREFLQAQVETATPPCTSFAEARAELHYMRGVLATIAGEHGLAILASGTHPTAIWRDAVQSGNERYDMLMNDLQMIGRRNMLCGMHVHVELPDPDRRIDVMYRMLPYLPLFLALSTSSPFWQSRLTGLKGYRLAAYDELPRTGIPELFRTQEDYDRYVAALVRAGAMKDSSYVWWAIRPSAKYPTLELRAPDCCTRVDDAIAIAALYRVLVRHLYFDPVCNRDMDAVSRAIALENKWRAQRYGVQCNFVTESGAVTVRDFLDQVIVMTAEDAGSMDCADEIAHCRTIANCGTSADAQIGVFKARAAEHGEDVALAAVNNWIAEQTLRCE